MKLLPSESVLTGKTIRHDGRGIADDTTYRIVALDQDYLVKLGTSDAGWSILFRDPAGLRFWELTYPHSARQGGGPAKYGDSAVRPA